MIWKPSVCKGVIGLKLKKTLIMKYLKNLLIALVILIAAPLMAQEEDNEEQKEKKRNKHEIKTLAKNGHSGGYGAIGFRNGEFADRNVVMGTVRGAWSINRVLAIGVEMNGIVPTAKYDNITTTNSVILLGGYGGLMIEPIVFSNQLIHVTFPITGGAGWLGYDEDWKAEAPLTI